MVEWYGKYAHDCHIETLIVILRKERKVHMIALPNRSDRDHFPGDFEGHGSGGRIPAQALRLRVPGTLNDMWNR